MAINLLDLFSSATSALNQSKEQLNQADEYNHDHGSNMVQIFNLITNAIGQKKNEPPSNQLQYAGQVLQQNTTSGSGNLYSQALQTAAQQFKGQDIGEGNIVSLIQTLLAGGQQPKPMTAPASSGGDVLGSLLGGLLGGGQQQTPSQQTGAGDLLGSLLGSMTGGGQQQGGGNILGSLLGGLLGGGGQQQSGAGGILGSLLGSFIRSGGAASLLSNFVDKSPLGETPTRAASGMIVAQSLLQSAGKQLGMKPVKTGATKSATAKKPTTKAGAKKAPAKKSAAKKGSK